MAFSNPLFDAINAAKAAAANATPADKNAAQLDQAGKGKGVFAFNDDPTKYQIGLNDARQQGLAADAAAAGNRKAPMLNTTQDSQGRGTQQNLINALQARMNGQGPSAAMQVMNNSIAQNNAAARSAAASAAGLSPAERLSMMNRAEAAGVQNATGQASAARAQEMNDAASQLGTVATNQRAQDMSNEQQNLASQQGQNALNQNQQQFDTSTEAQRENEQLNANLTQEQIESQNYNTAETLGAQEAMAAAQRKNNTVNTIIGGGLSALGSGMGAFIASDERVKANIASGNSQVQQLLNSLTAQVNGSPQVGSDAIGKGIASAVGSIGAGIGKQLKKGAATPSAPANTSAAYTDEMNAAKAGIDPTQGFGGAGDTLAMPAIPDAAEDAAMALSDENEKENVSTGGKQAQSFMDALKARTFDYKAPEQPYQEGPQLGVMAQDVEKSPLGKQAVVEDDLGRKNIFMPKAVGAALAGLGKLNQDVQELKAAQSGENLKRIEAMDKDLKSKMTGKDKQDFVGFASAFKNGAGSKAKPVSDGGKRTMELVAQRKAQKAYDEKMRKDIAQHIVYANAIGVPDKNLVTMANMAKLGFPTARTDQGLPYGLDPSRLSTEQKQWLINQAQAAGMREREDQTAR